MQKLPKCQCPAARWRTFPCRGEGAEQIPKCVQVQALFADCGEINAITIPVDKFTGRAKGFAYLEFAAKVPASCRATSLLCVARSVCQSCLLGATRGTCRRLLTASSCCRRSRC